MLAAADSGRPGAGIRTTLDCLVANKTKLHYQHFELPLSCQKESEIVVEGLPSSNRPPNVASAFESGKRLSKRTHVYSLRRRQICKGMARKELVRRVPVHRVSIAAREATRPASHSILRGPVPLRLRSSGLHALRWRTSSPAPQAGGVRLGRQNRPTTIAVAAPNDPERQQLQCEREHGGYPRPRQRPAGQFRRYRLADLRRPEQGLQELRLSYRRESRHMAVKITSAGPKVFERVS